jgi:hypothetical protein
MIKGGMERFFCFLLNIGRNGTLVNSTLDYRRSHMDKIIESLLKIRSPLTIGGLSVTVFYLLYEKILQLGIFSNLGEDSTAFIISNILNKVFYFALIALFIGVGSHIYLSIQNRKGRSEVTIVDAALDPTSKKYTERREDEVVKIAPGESDDKH